jgi:shikimate kinase
MGVGKTTVGELLARRLGRAFVDCDADLQRRVGVTAAEYADHNGMHALHAVEAEVLLDALTREGAQTAVITAAASTIDDPACRVALGDAYVVWLRGDVEVLARRAVTSRHRPLDDDAVRQLREQADRRTPLFAATADVVVDTTEKTPDGIAAALAQRARPSSDSFHDRKRV